MKSVYHPPPAARLSVVNRHRKQVAIMRPSEQFSKVIIVVAINR
jgi:hypothetical protein